MFLIAPGATLGFSHRLALVVGGLRQMIAAHGGRHRESGPLVILLWNRLGRIVAQFSRVEARAALPPGARTAPERPTPERPATEISTRKPSPDPGPAPAVPPRNLPRGYGWLARMVPGSAVFGSQLRALLEEPEMAAFVAATPRAAALLRPLLRMLATDPPPSMARPTTPRRPRPRRPRPTGGGRQGLIPHGPASTWLSPAQIRQTLGLPRRKPRD